MGELEIATVTAADDAWVGAPTGSQIVETAEFRIARLPERFPDPLQVQWVRSARPAATVLTEIVEQAAGFGLPETAVCVKPSAPADLAEALLARGAELVDTADVLAMPLPSDLGTTELPGLEVRWRTTPKVGRDANTVGIATFGGTRAPDVDVALQAASDRETVAAGFGGAVVAYLDDTPVAVAGLEVADNVARLWGGGVLEAHRGRGVYRALVAARLTYAVEHGATMALTKGRVSTSSPILRRLGFVSYGQERTYRLAL